MCWRNATRCSEYQGPKDSSRSKYELWRGRGRPLVPRLYNKCPARVVESKCNCPWIGTGGEKAAYLRGIWGKQLEIYCIIKEKLCFCLGGGWKECLGEGCGPMGVYSLSRAEFHGTLKKRLVEGMRDRWARVGLTEWGRRGKKLG